MNHRHYLKKKAVKFKSESVQKAYKLQRNRVNRLITSTKRKFCTESIDSKKQSPTEMWKNIKLIIGRGGRHSKSTKISSLETGNVDIYILLRPEVNTLLRLFRACRMTLTIPIPIFQIVSPAECNFHFTTISYATVYKTLKDIKTSKTAWLDNISTKITKWFSGYNHTLFNWHI